MKRLITKVDKREFSFLYYSLFKVSAISSLVMPLTCMTWIFIIQREPENDICNLIAEKCKYVLESNQRYSKLQYPGSPLETVGLGQAAL